MRTVLQEAVADPQVRSAPLLSPLFAHCLSYGACTADPSGKCTAWGLLTLCIRRRSLVHSCIAAATAAASEYVSSLDEWTTLSAMASCVGASQMICTDIEKIIPQRV